MLIYLSMLESGTERRMLFKNSGYPCNKRDACLVIIVMNKTITILRNRQKELPLDDGFANKSSIFENRDENRLLIGYKQ